MVSMPVLADLLLLVSGSLAAAIASIALRNRPRNGTTTLAVLLALISAWSFIHLIEHYASGPFELGLAKLKFGALAPTAFLWLAFVLAYSGHREFLDRRSLAVLLAWPVFVAAAVWVPADAGTLPAVWLQIEGEQGPVYWIHVGLSFGLLAVGSVLLLRHVVSTTGLFRQQGLAVLAAVGAAWGGALVSVFELFGDTHLHSMPVGIVVMGSLLLWAITGTGLTQITPIARRRVMETLDAGVLTLDDNRRVTSVNPAARALLGIDGDVIGRPARSVVGHHDELADWLRDADTDADAASKTVELGDVIVRGELTPLRDGDRFVGLVLLLQDRTEEQRRRDELERQKHRLEEFSGMVAHDLRNPLTVAKGRVQLERAERDSENLETAEAAIDRMDALIGELRTLARSGSLIESTEPVSLAELGNECWQVVETGSAELTVGADVDVEADRERLRQLLENLFGNAVQHGGDGVSVQVGPLADGFYVADDGPGIPPEVRDDVLEPGVSIAADGTGLGLAIAAEVADAHGWEIRVTESAEGGARFEFTGVSIVA